MILSMNSLESSNIRASLPVDMTIVDQSKVSNMETASYQYPFVIINWSVYIQIIIIY